MRWLVVAAVLLACKGKQAPPPKRDDARVQPIDAASADAAVDAVVVDAAVMSTTITPTGVGPITDKNIDEDDYKQLLVGFTIKTEHREAEDYNFDEYIASKDGKKILRAVITDRSLFKIEVDDPMFATAAGVAVGTTVGDAAEKMKDLRCVFEIYDPQADAERVEKSLRCDAPSLPQVMFEVDLKGFKGAEGSVAPKSIAKRKIVQIVWLAAKE
ncbi:MAG TPA: hypothetical protein VIV40_27095 [Kofleriaceae bacterium]